MNSITITKDEYDKLGSYLKQQLKSPEKAENQPANGSLIEELHVRNEERYWTSENANPAVTGIRNKFLDIANWRIIVKTSDLLVNNDYKDVLLGELVSDVLSK